MRRLACASVVSCLSWVAGCHDPLHDQTVEALGPEVSGVPAGPLHRPGQPCVLCHDGRGPGNMVLSLAGTIYQVKDQPEPLVDAVVHVADSGGRRSVAGTNCAGNFFIQSADFEPQFPAWVWVEFGGALVPMNSPIFREGSCAVCHADPAGSRSAGQVFLSPLPITFPDSGCP